MVGFQAEQGTMHVAWGGSRTVGEPEPENNSPNLAPVPTTWPESPRPTHLVVTSFRDNYLYIIPLHESYPIHSIAAAKSRLPLCQLLFLVPAPTSHDGGHLPSHPPQILQSLGRLLLQPHSSTKEQSWYDRLFMNEGTQACYRLPEGHSPC